MKTLSLMMLRVSIGLLVLLWGIDKVIDVEHGLAISNRFYAGAFSSEILLIFWGVIQSGIGILAVIGLFRRWVLPIMAAINLATLVVVWRSILDPWGWVLESTNVLFFPSLAIAAGSVLVWAFMDEDRLSLDHRYSLGQRDTTPAQPVGKAASY